MAKFNAEGIGKISDTVNNEITDFTDRLRALSKASEEYTSFSGKSDSMKGSVKFVIETDRIGTDE